MTIVFVIVKPKTTTVLSVDGEDVDDRSQPDTQRSVLPHRASGHMLSAGGSLV